MRWRRQRWRGSLPWLAGVVLLGAASAWLARAEEGTVVAVSDGDTIVVRYEGKNTRVRLAEIDAPELRQAYGQQARDFLSGLVQGRKVHLEVIAVDRYDRLVARVRTEDGRNVSEELLRAGLAWCYRQCGRSPSLRLIEQEARASRRGLWAEENPLPPWLYRRMHPIVR